MYLKMLLKVVRTRLPDVEDDILMQWCVDNDFCGEAAGAVRYDADFIWHCY